VLELAAAATAFSSGGKPTPLPQRRRRSEHSHVRHCVVFNSAAVCVNAASGGGRQLEAALEPEGPPSGGGVDTYWLEGVLPLLS